MKNQYFADERDFVKYDLWIELAETLGEATALRFIPMLTLNDGSTQGGKVRFECGERRKDLFDFLQRSRDEGKRSITQLREFFRFRAPYRAYKDTDTEATNYFNHRGRQEYFAAIEDDWLRNSAILIDPDTGLETESRFWRKRPERYLQYAEVVSVAAKARAGSLILLVQFPQRNANVAEREMNNRAARLREALSSAGLTEWTVRWIAQKKGASHKVGEIAFFVLAWPVGPAERVESMLTLYAKRHHMKLNCPERTSEGGKNDMEATQAAQDLRYPVGKFHWKGDLNPTERAELINQIADVPARLREAVKGLTPEQLDTPYRPDGWTVRQVVHHVPDSHLNSYVRFKLALTETQPTIKTYDQGAWANLADSKSTSVETSLALLEALHERWVNLLRSMSPADFARTLNHPEMGQVTLDRMVALYAWHGRHHVGHITALRKRMGWL